MSSFIKLDSPKESIELHEIHSSQAGAGVPSLNVALSALSFAPISPGALSPGARSARQFGPRDERRGRLPSIPSGMSLSSPVSAHSAARVSTPRSHSSESLHSASRDGSPDSDRSSPESMAYVSRSPSPAAMKEVDPHALAIAQTRQLAQRGDIVAAAACLEHSGFLEPRDLSMAFDIHDHTFGEIWRGVYSIGTYALYTATTITNLEELQEFFLSNRKKFVMFVQNDNGTKKLHLFRLAVGAGPMAGIGIEYLDRTKGTWRAAKQEDINALKLQEQDLFVALDDASVVPAIAKRCPVETPTNNVAPNFTRQEYFYHEEQTGLLCAVHASNAYFGRAIIDITHYRNWVRAYGAKLIDADTLYRAKACVADADSGVDAAVLCNYLNDTFHKRFVAAEIRKTSDINETEWSLDVLANLPKDCDRVILGYVTKEHFVTFRRSSKTGKWHMIDSFEELTTQCRGYDSLKEAIVKNSVAKAVLKGSPAYILFEKPAA